MTPRNRQPNSANDRPEDGGMWLSVAGSRNRNAFPGLAANDRHASRPGDDRTALPADWAKIHNLYGHPAATQSHSQSPPERVGRAYMPTFECVEGAVHRGPLPCLCGGRRAR
jgi:hypothetical protein